MNIELGDANPFGAAILNSTIVPNVNVEGGGTSIVANSLQGLPTSNSSVGIDAADLVDSGVAVTILNDQQPTALKGIYELQGNELRYCFAQPGQPRPTDFSVTEGSRHTMVRLQRFLTGEADLEALLKAANAHIRKDEIGWITNVEIMNRQDADELLEKSSQLKKLYSFGISNSVVSADGFRKLAELPVLDSLTVEAVNRKISGLEALATAPKLRSVSLKGRQIDDNVINPAKELIQLRHLSLTDTSVTTVAVADLVNQLANLTRLDVYNAVLSRDAWRAIGSLQNLQTLGAAGANVSDDDLREIGRVEGLEGLLIQNTQVTDEGLKHILSLPKLSFLRIGKNRITDVSLKRIADSLPALTTLYMHNLEGVTDEGLLELGRHPALSYVHISKGQFSEAAVEKLRAVREDLLVIE